jgi:hypothetical protein
VVVFLVPDDPGTLFGGDCNPCGWQDLHYGFGQWGTPVKFYLLHQIPTVDVSSVKLAIIHGARIMSTAVSDAVREKLQQDNRTLLWTGAPALLKDSYDDEFTRRDTVDLERIRAVTQLWGLVGSTSIESVRTQLSQGGDGDARLQVSSAGSPSAPVWLPESLRNTIPRGMDPSGIDGYTDGAGASNTTSPWFHWDPSIGGDSVRVLIRAKPC